MSAPLLPCPQCQRHIRITEVRCPFCSGGLGVGWAEPGLARRSELRDGQARPSGRLSRAALVAAGTLALAPAACGGEASDDAPAAGGKGAGGTENVGGTDTAAGGDSVGPVYGAPADGGSESNASGGFPSSGGNVYGAPPTGGAGSNAAGGNTAAGGADGTGAGGDNVGPVYGLPADGGATSNGSGGDQNSLPVYGGPPTD